LGEEGGELVSLPPELLLIAFGQLDTPADRAGVDELADDPLDLGRINSADPGRSMVSSVVGGALSLLPEESQKNVLRRGDEDVKAVD